MMTCAAEISEKFAGFTAIGASADPQDLDIAQDLFDQGCVYVIEFSSIRANSGALWERTHQGVYERLRGILRRLLPSPIHRITGVDHTRCVVAAPGVSTEVGLTACVRANYELVLGLLGRCELGDLHVARARWDAEVGLVQDRLGSDELIELAEEAKLENLSIPRQLRRKAQRYNEQPQPGDHRIPASAKIGVTFGFEPVWDARKEVVCMYACRPQTITAGDSPETFALNDLNIQQRARVELDGLVRGAELLPQYVEKGDRFLLNVAVSFETLSSPARREEFIEICRGILPAYRQYMIFMLTDIPLGVSAARLSQFAMLLRGFGRVIATIASGNRNFSPYLNIGLSSIALDLSIRAQDLTRLQADILHVAAAGRQFKLGAALFGVRTGDTTGIAHAADIRLFHGPAIGPALDEPKRMSYKARDAVVPNSENAGEEEWF